MNLTCSFILCWCVAAAWQTSASTNETLGVRDKFTKDEIRSLTRVKRKPFSWPNWDEIGKGIKGLGEKIGSESDKIVKNVDEAIKNVDFKQIGDDIKQASQKVYEEVKNPVEALVNPVKLVKIEDIQNEENNRNAEESGCIKKAVQKPDFSAPSRRKSEIMCLDYKWEINALAVESNRLEACRREDARRGLYYVLGGENTSPGEFPHMAAIGWKSSVGTWVFKCGGSLISPRFVLTAAHCSSASPRDPSINGILPQIVRLGDKNIIDKEVDGVTPVEIAITRRFVPPQYASPKKYFDIALFELEKDAPFTNQVHPACLWSKAELEDTRAVITGWGVVQSGGRQQSPELQKATIDLLETVTCRPLLRSSMNRHWQGFEEHQLCAGVLKGGIDTCQGDSGGPLQVKHEDQYYVVGVTSFGVGCGNAGQPGIYTRVSSFLDWIESVVWPSK